MALSKNDVRKAIGREPSDRLVVLTNQLVDTILELLCAEGPEFVRDSLRAVLETSIEPMCIGRNN